MGAALGQAEVVSLIQQEVKALAHGRRVLGVGIGAPGAISLDKGTITSSANYPKWKDFPLKDMVEEGVGLSVILENDANAFAIGEHVYGAARGLENFIGVTLGTGVGSGLILNGRIWHGNRGMAGEIGHITVESRGERCNCGNFGCLELYSSATGLVRMAKRAIEEGKKTSLKRDDLTPERMAEAAAKGDRMALSLFKRAGCCLGLALATTFNLLNIEVAVLGGGVSNAWDLFKDPLLNEVKMRAAYTMPGTEPQVIRGVLGDDAAVLGCAALVFQRYL